MMPSDEADAPRARGDRSGARRYLTPLFLVLAAAAATVYAYAADRGSITDGERASRPKNLFPAFRRDDVRRIELAHGAETMVLERDTADAGDVGWTMVAPVAGKVELPAVDNLLGVLDFASVVRRVDGEAPSGAPRARGVIAMGPITYRFTLGGPAAMPEGAAYLTLDGEGTFVVGRELVAELSKGADAYRDRTIVPYLSIDLRRLEVRPGEGARGGFAIDRIDDVSFRLEGSGVRASRETLDRVWGALAEIRAEAFLRDGELGADAKPIFTVTMTPRDPSRRPGELAVFDACPGHPDNVAVVRRSPSPLAACVPKSALAGLGTRADELADARLFATRPEEVTEIRLEEGSRRLELARKGGGWHERSPSDRDLDADQADLATDLVKALVTGAGEIGAPPGGAAFAPEVRARVWRGDEQTAPELVEIGAAGGKSYARRVADGALVAIAPSLRSRFAAREIRGRAIWDPPLDGSATSIVLRGCGVDQELTRDAHGFHYGRGARPEGLPADTSRAIDLADALAHLRAEAWIADEADPALVPEAACSVTATFDRASGEGAARAADGGVRVVRVRFGARSPEDGRVFAAADGVRGVFTVPAALRDLAGELYVDRNALFTPPETIASVVVSAPGRGEERFDEDADPALDAGSSVPFDVGHLRAEAALHTGPPAPAEGFASPTAIVRIAVRGDAGPRESRITIGAATKRAERNMHFARIDGVDATFVVADDRIPAVLATAAALRAKSP